MVATGGPSTEYEFTTPGEYGAGTGEYEFGLLQDKKTSEHLLDAKYQYATAEGIERLDVMSDDEEEAGSTLIMDKPNIKKTIAPESAVLPERAPAASHVKHKQKHNNSSSQSVLAVALCTLVIVFIGVMFFFVSKATRHFQTGGQDHQSPATAPSNSNEERASALARRAISSHKGNYALGFAPFTATSKGGLKYKTKVVSFNGVSDDAISKLQAQGCTDISLEGVAVSDNDLQSLAKLKNIYMLDLQNTHGYSSDGLRVFKGTTLKRLHLDGTGISDNWIPVIAELPLECLTVMGNNLSDESIHTLANSKTLKFLKFEADDSPKIQSTFSVGSWMRLPEGSNKVFNYYRGSTEPKAR